LVKIAMVGRSMSGNSCRGKCFRLSTPNREISKTVTPIATGLRMAPAMMRTGELPDLSCRDWTTKQQARSAC
jgi:hypothetical protein